MHNSSNSIWPSCSFPPAALGSMNLTSVGRGGAHSPAPCSHWSKVWERLCSLGARRLCSLPAAQMPQGGFSLWCHRAGTHHKPFLDTTHRHKPSWQQKGGKGMTKFVSFRFNFPCKSSSSETDALQTWLAFYVSHRIGVIWLRELSCISRARETKGWHLYVPSG